MAYTKIPVAPGDVISSSWGNHIQTQYDEAISWANAENVTVISPIAADVSGSEYPYGVTMFNFINVHGYPVDQGTALNINDPNPYRFAQIITYSTQNNTRAGETLIRIWRQDSGWSPFRKIWDSNNLPNPAQTDVENRFTAAQRVQNLLRFAATSESGIIQAGENSNDTNARLRIARSNTTASSIALMEIFSEEVKISGNAFTSSATPTGSGNGYFRNAYIHNADPSGGSNGDVYYKY